MRLPLEDVKVLDLTHALAGPFCSTMLADFGADVIKVEPPGAGDIARGWGSPMPGGETAYFVALHRGKRGVVIDFKKPEGKELLVCASGKRSLAAAQEFRSRGATGISSLRGGIAKLRRRVPA